MSDKPRGRPPLDGDPSVAVSFRLTTKQYEASLATAQAQRLTMAEWIRRVLRAATGAKQPGGRRAG
jgi:hypothetical protein